MITELETIILSTILRIYDSWGWFGVVTLFIFENAAGTTPGESVSRLAGWILGGCVMPCRILARLARRPFINFFIVIFKGVSIWYMPFMGTGNVFGHEWALISTYLNDPCLIYESAVLLHF